MPKPEMDPFARDLGYLQAFLDKLEGQAAALGPEVGRRLRTLVTEERSRWDEIRTLLKPGAAAPIEPARPAPVAHPGPGVEARGPVAKAPRALTVGSLRRR